MQIGGLPGKRVEKGRSRAWRSVVGGILRKDRVVMPSVVRTGTLE